MRLFKTEMLFLASPARAMSTQAIRPRYGGRGLRSHRTPMDRPEAGASICILDPADPRSCACRDRKATWGSSCDMDRAA